jgi:hypothetical protein
VVNITTPAALTPGKNPRTHWRWGWMGTIAYLDVMEKKKNILLLPRFELQTTYPVA